MNEANRRLFLPGVPVAFGGKISNQIQRRFNPLSLLLKVNPDEIRSTGSTSPIVVVLLYRPRVGGW